MSTRRRSSRERERRKRQKETEERVEREREYYSLLLMHVGRAGVEGDRTIVRTQDEKDPTPNFTSMMREWEEGISMCMTKASRRQLDTAWRRWEEWVKEAKREDPTIDPFKPHYTVYCAFVYYYLSIYKPSTVTTYLKRMNTAAREKGE